MSNRTVFHLISLAILSAVLTSCSFQSDSFFPLNQGAQWVYKTVQKTGAVETTSTLEIVVDGVVHVGDQETQIRRASTGHLWALRNDSDGIKRMAARRDVDDEFAADAEPRYVLKAPYAVGTNWAASTVPFLLARRGEFPPELIHAHKTQMTHTISAVNETVTVVAGTFSPCLRVEASGVLKLYVDPVIGVTDVPLTGVEWYCKGAGLVKLTRTEKINSPFLTGGDYTMELTQFSR
jgi:hypothetical protein